jgi:hypothetical protein
LGLEAIDPPGQGLLMLGWTVVGVLPSSRCFAIAAALGLLGMTSIARWPTRNRLMLAAIPLLFGVQVGAAGALWVTLHDRPDPMLHRIAVATFLGTGLVVWPGWLSWSLAAVERDALRRRILTRLVPYGILVALCAAVLLVRWHPTAILAAHGIEYALPAGLSAADKLICLSAYLAVAIVPLFVSTTSLTRAMGVTLGASLVLAALVEPDALTTVWCLFSAILSGLVSAAIWVERRLDGMVPLFVRCPPSPASASLAHESRPHESRRVA